MQVIFIVSYKIKSLSKKDYFKTIKLIKAKMNELGMNYNVYEQKGKDIYFEFYFFDSYEEFDSMDENIPENIKILIDTLKHYIDGEINYQTLIQME